MLPFSDRRTYETTHITTHGLECCFCVTVEAYIPFLVSIGMSTGPQGIKLFDATQQMTNDPVAKLPRRYPDSIT